MKMKNRSHRYDINRPTSRYGHKYSKYKRCISVIVIRIRQHLSNISNLIQENVKLRLSWKKTLLIKKACIFESWLVLDDQTQGLISDTPHRDYLSGTYAKFSENHTHPFCNMIFSKWLRWKIIRSFKGIGRKFARIVS